MASFEEELHDGIAAVVANWMKKRPVIIIGFAKNVNDLTCDIERFEAPTIHQARLNALEEPADGSYATIVPKEGSTVLAGIIENDQGEAVVLSCTEIEKIIWKAGNSTLEFKNGSTKVVTGDSSFELKNDVIEFNGGQLGGIPTSSKIDDNLDAIKQRFATLEAAIATGLSSAAAMDTSAGATFTTTMQASQLTFDDMQNNKVKH
jgi:hypothetical protein